MSGAWSAVCAIVTAPQLWRSRCSRPRAPIRRTRAVVVGPHLPYFVDDDDDRARGDGGEHAAGPSERIGVEARVRRAVLAGRCSSSTRWATCYYWSATTCTNASTDELQLYTPTNVQRRRRCTLRLTARRELAFGAGGRVRLHVGHGLGRDPRSHAVRVPLRLRRDAGPDPGRPWTLVGVLAAARAAGAAARDRRVRERRVPARRRAAVHALARGERRAAVRQRRRGPARLGRRLARLRPRLGADVAHLVRRRPQGLDDGQPAGGPAGGHDARRRPRGRWSVRDRAGRDHPLPVDVGVRRVKVWQHA